MPVAPRGAWLLAVLACCSSPAVAVAYGAPSFAVCLNGQTKRLELASKIEHVFVPNLQAGYRVEVFAHLDASPGPVKRTAWSTLQVDTFANCTERSLASALEAATLAALEASAGGRGRFRPANFAVHASFATPAATDYVYEIVGDKSFLPLGQDFGGADRRA